MERVEKFLSLQPTSNETGFWKAQLEGLKFHSAVCSGADNSMHDVQPPEVIKARLITKPEPSYTSAAKRAGVEGTVVLRAIFAADGKIKHVIVIQGLPNGLTQVAIDAAKLIEFSPANLNGKPVSMFMQLEYNFNLYTRTR